MRRWLTGLVFAACGSRGPAISQPATKHVVTAPPVARRDADAPASVPVANPLSADPIEALRQSLQPRRDFLGRILAADDAQLWWQLAEDLERVPAGPEREALLERGRAAANTWPDALREANYPTMQRWASGTPPAIWPLVRGVKLDGAELRMLLERGVLGEITELTLRLGSSEGDCTEAHADFGVLAEATGLGALRSLTLALPACGGPALVARLGELGKLGGVRRLALPRVIGPDEAAALAKVPWLAQLEELDLGTSKPRAAGLVVLGRSPHLRGLRVLRLRRSLDRLEDLHGLATRTGWEGLRVLDLGENNVDDAGLRALGGSKALARLEELDLTRLVMDPEEMASLIAGGGLPGLAVLRLDGNPFGDRGVASLAAVRRWDGLRELSLVGVGFGPEGARRLAEASQWTKLEALDLRRNLVEVGGEALVRAPFIAGLRRVGLSGCGLGAAAVLTLVERLQGPEQLLLAEAEVGDAGARAIAARREWSGLRELDLRKAGVGVEGFEALAVAPQLAGLRSFEIAGNEPGEAGWRALVGSTYLRSFVSDDWREELALHDTRLTPADAARQIPDDFELVLERRGRLTIFADGRVEYQGWHDPGPFRGKIDATRLRLILGALEPVLKEVDRPVLGDPRCRSIISDLPAVRLAVRIDTKELQLDSEKFCNGTEGWGVLSWFAARVDALVGTGRWAKQSARRPATAGR